MDLRKTSVCRLHRDSGPCKLVDCKFAHSPAEMRPRPVPTPWNPHVQNRRNRFLSYVLSAEARHSVHTFFVSRANTSWIAVLTVSNPGMLLWQYNQHFNMSEALEAFNAVEKYVSESCFQGLPTLLKCRLISEEILPTLLSEAEAKLSAAGYLPQNSFGAPVNLDFLR